MRRQISYPPIENVRPQPNRDMDDRDDNVQPLQMLYDFRLWWDLDSKRDRRRSNLFFCVRSAGNLVSAAEMEGESGARNALSACTWNRWVLEERQEEVMLSPLAAEGRRERGHRPLPEGGMEEANATCNRDTN